VYQIQLLGFLRFDVGHMNASPRFIGNQPIALENS
jgi:hypothetical protein